MITFYVRYGDVFAGRAADESPYEKAQKRFAPGEISFEEFQEIQRRLADGFGGRSS